MTTSTVLATTTSVAHADYLSLSYRSDLQMVVLRWLRDASLPELQLGHQAALHLARHHAATHWFVDVRRRLVVDTNHTGWVIDNFLPKAASLLPAPLRVAYLTSPSRQRIIAHNPDMQATIARMQFTAAYHLQTFLDEASAMTWLFEA